MTKQYVIIEELDSTKTLKTEYGNLISFYAKFEEEFGEITNPDEEIRLINAYHDLRACNKAIEINDKNYELSKILE